MTRTQASPARTAAARKRAAANPLDPASLVIASVPIAGDRFHAVYSPADHVIRAGGFGDPEALLDRLLGPAPEREPGSVSSGDAGSTTRVRAQADEDEVTRALRAYAAGDRAALDALRVEQPGTEFRHAVWQALRAVPAGETVSYTELA
ncbi:MGMT family protein, partial [Leucobacter sp. M11]|nr:MGMT family protein [Leucobacter sp. M11]